MSQSRFTRDVTLGIHRAGSRALRVAANGTDLWRWTATENRGLQATSVTTGGLTVDADGATVTRSLPPADEITAEASKTLKGNIQ